MCVCLSFMRYYTIHPIATKLWEVVEYTPAKVIGEKKFKKKDLFPPPPGALIINREAARTGTGNKMKEGTGMNGNVNEREREQNEGRNAGNGNGN